MELFFLSFSGPMFTFPKSTASGTGLFGAGTAGSTGTSGSGAVGSSLFSGTMNAAAGAGTPSATGTTTVATGTSTGSGPFGNMKPADNAARPATSSCEYRVTTEE
jgi:hypothetical protein